MRSNGYDINICNRCVVDDCGSVGPVKHADSYWTHEVKDVKCSLSSPAGNSPERIGSVFDHTNTTGGFFHREPGRRLAFQRGPQSFALMRSSGRRGLKGRQLGRDSGEEAVVPLERGSIRGLFRQGFASWRLHMPRYVVRHAGHIDPHALRWQSPQ